jgi:glucosylceramidase
LLRQARALTDGRLTIFANPHSAPAWMKRNNALSNFEPDSCILGYCKDLPASADVRDQYVQYFVDFVRAYQSMGVPIRDLGVQNEPGSSADYPSGDFAPADQADFIARLKRAFAAQRPPLTPRVWGESTDPVGAPAILADPATRPFVDGISYHCYGLSRATLDRSLDAVAAFRAAYPDKTIHETECTQDKAQIWDKTIDILIEHSRRGASSVAAWNIALDPSGGPHSVACSVVREGQCFATDRSSILTAPVVVSGPHGRARARFTREYYELGQVSKYVRPGAVRIGSTEPAGLHDVAFRNRDGSTVLVVHNRGRAPRAFSVNIGGRRHVRVDDLPADGIATLVW